MNLERKSSDAKCGGNKNWQATSLEDLVANDLRDFPDIAEEVIKETQEKEGFLEGYND